MRSTSPFITAVSTGDIEFVEYLLKLGADIDAEVTVEIHFYFYSVQL